MLQGSGFLQWTSIFCILLNEKVDVLLLDEPDAHLHPNMQIALAKSLQKMHIYMQHCKQNYLSVLRISAR